MSSDSLTVKRAYGQLAAYLSASPAKFGAIGPTTLKLTVHATSANGGPLAGASVSFTVGVYGLSIDRLAPADNGSDRHRHVEGEHLGGDAGTRHGHRDRFYERWQSGLATTNLTTT